MDADTWEEVALQLRERYPDDDEFAAAMERAEAAARDGDGGATMDDSPGG